MTKAEADALNIIKNGPAMLQSLGKAPGKRNAFTVHNYHGRRYYSSIDAAILLNGKVVDEVVMIQWTVDEQTMPLFGYNSYIWDDVAKGSRVVSGQFAINFTVPDYLNQLIAGQTEDSIRFENTGVKINNDEHDALYDASFNIHIGYGSKDSITKDVPYTVLNNVYVRSTGQAPDTQGQNLVETYSFIAQDRNMSR